MNVKVDEFLQKTYNGQAGLEKQKAILLNCLLTEEFRWNQCSFTFRKTNLNVLNKCMDYCVPGSFKGARFGIFAKSGKNSQSIQQIRLHFTSARQSRISMHRVENLIPKALDGTGLDDW